MTVESELFLNGQQSRSRDALAQWAKEFSDVLCEKVRLLHRGKMAAPGHDRPTLDVVAALCEHTWRDWNFLGEDGHCHWGRHAVCGGKLKWLLSRLVVQPCRGIE